MACNRSAEGVPDWRRHGHLCRWIGPNQRILRSSMSGRCYACRRAWAAERRWRRPLISRRRGRGFR
eukprot:393128-Prorocentrum_minimum.AAC.2